MVFDPLTTMSACLTYFLQVAFVYLVIWGLCSLIRAPRTRVWMWSAFLLLSGGYWIWRCVAMLGVFSSQTAAPVATGDTASAVGWTWAVAPSHASRLVGIPTWAAITYLAIVAGFLFHLAGKAWSLRRFLATGQQPSRELDQLFFELCSEMEVDGCELSLVPGLRSPATAHWWHPRVVLPAELVPELDTPQLANVLRHELIHVARRDYLWERLAALACRIVFFHPVMWMAHRRLRWERELACDEAVVRQCDEQRIQYAECLTSLARWWFIAERNSRGAIGFASSASLLGTRVRALLHEPVHYNPFQRMGRTALVLLMFAVTAASLPGMRLTLYWAVPQVFSRTEPLIDKPIVAPRARLVTRQQKTVVQSHTATAEDPAGSPSTSVPPHVPAVLSAIDKPAMPIYSGARSYEPAADTSADLGATASAPTGTWNESGGTAPRAKQGPNWKDTAIGAITTGIAIIRSRGDSSPTVGGGGRSGGGEGPEDFLPGSSRH